MAHRRRQVRVQVEPDTVKHPTEVPVDLATALAEARARAAFDALTAFQKNELLTALGELGPTKSV